MTTNINLGYILFNFVISILQFLVSLILTPINLILSPLIPVDISTINIAIDNVFNFLNDSIYFIMGWLHLPSLCYTMIGGFIVFIIAYIPISIGFKLVLNFYKIFKG